MKFCVTYCSEKKRAGLLPPDQLYISNRIDRFTRYCKQNHLRWAILSAKHGLLFPSQKRGPYNITLRSDKKYWLGVSVMQHGKKLPIAKSNSTLKLLVEKVQAQVNKHSVSQIAFYAPNPKRAKCYLALMHLLLDHCTKAHSWLDLLDCIRKHTGIKVSTQPTFDC